MAREHEDTPIASGAVVIRKNHVRGCKRAKKQPQDPFASSYGQVPFTKVPAGSLTEEGDLGEAAVGRSVVFFVTVRAIRPVSNTMAAMVLHRNLSTERCVVVAGAFAGITTRMVRFATTLSRHSLVIVDGVVALSKSTQKVEILVNKLHSISLSDPTYPIKLDDAARSDENFGTWKAEQACPLCRLRNERKGAGAFQSY